MDPKYHPAFDIIRSGFEPFNPKTELWLRSDYDFTFLSYVIFVEFPGMPEFNQEFKYPDKEFHEVGYDDLFLHFSKRVFDHIRNFRIEPEDNIELGEN